MYYTVIKHFGHLRTLEKCRKHSPAARVFYISLVFSNARRVLSQCNTRLRLLYLLNIGEKIKRSQHVMDCSTSQWQYKIGISENKEVQCKWFACYIISAICTFHFCKLYLWRLVANHLYGSFSAKASFN